MLGAIIGDIVGSVYEFVNIKTKEFVFLSKKNYFTDDTLMTIAVMKTLLDKKIETNDTDFQKELIENMQYFGRKYPANYGGRFSCWLYNDTPKPYKSYGNGSSMRISPVGFYAKNIEEVKSLSRLVSEVTHNHPEGIKGAEAIAVCIFLARLKKSKDEIKQKMGEYYPEILNSDFNYNFLVKEYGWNYGDGSVTCQSSVPEAIVCFLESTGFEDAIRNAISIGGDSDTIGAMVGGIAEAYYGIPKEIERESIHYLPRELGGIISHVYPNSIYGFLRRMESQ